LQIFVRRPYKVSAKLYKRTLLKEATIAPVI